MTANEKIKQHVHENTEHKNGFKIDIQKCTISSMRQVILLYICVPYPAYHAMLSHFVCPEIMFHSVLSCTQHTQQVEIIITI